MSLRSKMEAVIYASEDPVTLQQLTGLLAEEVEAELERLAALQAELPLGEPARDESELAENSGALEKQEQADESLDSAKSAAEAEPPYVSEKGIADGRAAEGLVVPETPAAGEETSQLAAESALPGSEAEKRRARERERAVRDHVRRILDQLMRDYAESDRGIEIREVAGGYRMGTKPEYHDAVRGFVKTLKPALKLSLQALETLAVIAYKQPVTAAEISEIRGVDSAGVLGGLMTRKLIATGGRKQVIGRPMLYKTTKEFLVRFGLVNVQELPSMEEFERMAGELTEQEELQMEETDVLVERANVRGDAEHVREVNAHGPETPDGSEAVAGGGDDEGAADELAEDEGALGEGAGASDAEPSEELVAQVLGVPDESARPTEHSPWQEEEMGKNGVCGELIENASYEGVAGLQTTEPIEAAAAMQAEQTGALAGAPESAPMGASTEPERGTTESEPL